MSAGIVERDPIHLSASAQVLEALRLGRVGVWRWRLGTDELQWSDNLEGIHALPGGTFDGTLSSFTGDIHPGDAAGVWTTIQGVIETGGPYEVVYRTNPPDGADPIWIRAHGGIVTGTDGERYLSGVCLDVTDILRTQRQLQRRLKQQQAVGALGTFALSEPMLATVLDRAVATAAEVLEVSFTSILEIADSGDRLDFRAGVGWTLEELADGVPLAPHTAAGRALLAGEPVVITDLATDKRFGIAGPLQKRNIRSGVSVLIAGSGQRRYGALGAHTTEKREFDAADVDFLQSIANIVAMSVRAAALAERRQLVIREMTHRAGNMLQLVSSIFNQTFRPGVDFEAAQPAFFERLGSLARANVLISSRGWTETRIISVLEEVLRPYEGRYVLDGHDLLLPADLSFDLSLVLHELGSNSAKYGAFARGIESARISWNLATTRRGREFRLDWHDPVTAFSAPLGTGFGTKLLGLLIERKWGGKVETSTRRGYRFSCRIPLPQSDLAEPPADLAATG
jgi:two-component sensor histidine kinase